MTGRWHTLAGVLTDHVPIEDTRTSDCVVEDCPWLRVGQPAGTSLLLHEFGLDALVDHYKDERHVFLVPVETLLDLLNLVLLDGGNLLVADSISEDDHSLREAL